MMREPKTGQEIFQTRVVPWMDQNGHSLTTIIETAEENQRQAFEGGIFALGPDEAGVSVTLQIGTETVDYMIGGIGPFAVALGAVRQIIADRQAQAS